MSLTIGIYDLFAYTIPGLFYLYVIYEFLNRLEVIRYRFSTIPNLPSGLGLLIFVLLVVAAHLLGHLLDIFAHWFVFRLFKPYKFSERTLQDMKVRHSNVDIQFQAKDLGLLFSMLRQRNQEHSQLIDSFEANSIMLRNISFGLFLLVLLQIYSIITNHDRFSMILAISLFILSVVARWRSHMFHAWFITDIFEGSLDYGNNVNEVLAYRRQKEAPKTENKIKTKTRRK